MQKQADLLKGAAYGALAGLAGGLVMEQFQNLWNKLTADESGSKNARPQLESKPSQEEEEPATVKTAEAISCEVFHHELTKDEREVAGPAVHYAVSVTTGVVYGALAELTPVTTIGFGLPFGAAVWAVADETIVPLLGLSKSPTEYPLSKHLYGLASHLIYGATTECTRRWLHRLK